MVWRGYGILVPFILVGTLLGWQGVLDDFMGQGYYADHKLLQVLGFIGDGLILLFLGLVLDWRKKANDFWFIPMKKWSIAPFFFAGVLFLPIILPPLQGRWTQLIADPAHWGDVGKNAPASPATAHKTTPQLPESNLYEESKPVAPPPPDLFSASKGGQVEQVNQLLASGSNLNLKDANGWTPLMHAASAGHAEIVQLLLEKGADVNVSDSNGWTPLMVAAYQGNVANVSALLAKGSEVNARSKKNTTALISAAGNGHADVVKILLEKGADTVMKDSDGKSALDYATTKGHEAVVKLLK